MFNQVNKKWKCDANPHKLRVITRYDNKLMAYSAVRFDNWVALQKLNPCYQVKIDGTIDY